MAGGQERVLRRRIRSIKSTQKITKAMELIAASQIVRAQARIAAARPYQQGMARIVLETAQGDPVAAGRLLGAPDEVHAVALLAIVADRGLCGGYNSNVLRATERFVRARTAAGVDVRLFTVGKKAQSYFRFRNQPVERDFAGFSERPTFTDAREVAAAVTAPFLNGEVDEVRVLSTRFLSAGTQRVEERQLLPLPDPRSDEPPEWEHEPALSAPDDADGPLGYTEFEPEAAELLETLAPRAAETAVFGALLEGAAAEVTARQRAMAAATENAGELITKYTRIMNRARQDSITTEIMEIVGGAEALRAGSEEEAGGIVIEVRA
ncbi:MAG: ATP synthase F1 subunit gamma [Acidimicrobiales bacterium]|nr:ATP synthase F1 subunit gamma [Acidimicrobiales bacterium]